MAMAMGSGLPSDSVRSFLEATSDGVWENDLRAGVSYLTEDWFRQLGYTANDFPQPGEINAWFSLVHPEDLPRVEQAYHKHIAGESPNYYQELRLRTSTGGWRWVVSRGRVVEWHDDGTPARVIGTHLDITEQKELEAELMASQLRNEMLLQAVPDLLFVEDYDGNVIDCSAPRPEFLLLPPKDFLGKNIRDFLPPDLAEGMLECVHQAVDTQKMQTIEYSLNIHGRDMEFEARLTPYGPGLASCIVRDITERRVIGRQLQEARGEYERLVRSLPVGVFSFRISRTKGIQSAFVSPRLEEVTRQPAEILRRGHDEFHRFVHPDDLPKAYAAMDRLFASETTLSDEIRCVDAAGKTFWIRVEIQSCDMRDDELRIHGTASDITAQKRAQAEYRELQLRLQRTERMQALGQLAGGVAHEFNNQLASVFFFVDSVKKGTLNREQLNRYADLLRTNAQRTSELTQKLLDFSRQGTPKRELFDLHEVLRESLDILDQTLGRNIDVVRSLQAKCSLVLGDPSQLSSLLLNLAINARDAMSEHGALTVATECLELTEDRCRQLRHESELPPGQYICLSVSDTGEGMKPEVREHIFEPFFTTKPVGKGTGLGLASVYGTVADHAGAISVTSVPGDGTTFQIFLPVCDAPPTKPTAEEPGLPVVRGAGQHLLLVDDETLLRYLLRRELEELGYTVTDCAGGRDALRILGQNPTGIDAVVLDVTMPTMSGLQTHRALQGIRQGIPTVAITGFTNHRDLPLLRKEGVLHVVPKPVDLGLLSQSLAELLGIPLPD